MLPHGQGYLEIHKVCTSNYTSIWLGLLLLNFFILLISVIVVAFKTSKIRYKHFRDAKATNIYAFLVSFITVMTIFYWFFFFNQEISISSVRRGCVYSLCRAHFVSYVLPIYPLHSKTLSSYCTRTEAME